MSLRRTPPPVGGVGFQRNHTNLSGSPNSSVPLNSLNSNNNIIVKQLAELTKKVNDLEAKCNELKFENNALKEENKKLKQNVPFIQNLSPNEKKNRV